MISGILSCLMTAYRTQTNPAVVVDTYRIDTALENWQRSWTADPKSRFSGPNSPLGSIAFNASTLYRATTVRRVKDYARFSPRYPT
jgi:hypothetical protein